MPKPSTQEQMRSAKERRQELFLAAYEEAGTIHGACRASRLNRRLHYKWLERDEAYVEKFLASQEIAGERLEEAARQRAVEGWTEPVFYEGEKVGEKPKYSDSLLIFLMKGALPEKYKERYEKTGEIEKSVNFNVDLSALSDEELRSLNKLVAEVGSDGAEGVVGRSNR